MKATAMIALYKAVYDSVKDSHAFFWQQPG